MPELLRIQEPTARGGQPQWRSFLELGFRPLYLAGCLWAAVSIALWIFAPGWLTGRLNPIAWHAHEMLWGFIATIALGFLLTAGANWTGTNPIQGRALGALAALWVIARLGFLMPGDAVFFIAAGAELLLFAGAAIALARVIFPAANKRNHGVPLLVLGLGATDAWYLQTALSGNHLDLMARFETGLLIMAVLALLIARRVIPFFAMRATAGLSIPLHTTSGLWQIGLALATIILGLTGQQMLAGVALALVGVIALIQVISWQPMRVRHNPLLWVLYAGYAALGAGLTVAALHDLGVGLRTAWSVHLIAVGGFSVLIAGMVTRTALGHLGRPLRADRLMVSMYLLVIAAAALRLIALIDHPIAQPAVQASALAWISAFVLYLWRFAPMLIRPKAG